ncbi:hypothetical protein P2318_32855 [Myxococcaceae bacterium GXIMD 01537]
MNTLTRPGAPERSIAVFLRVLATQVLFITPLFWLMELAQNHLWRAVSGDWGWVYPASPYGWFSFPSMVLWAGAVGIFWALHYFWFYPRDVSPWLRVLVGGLAGWAGEWVGGFLALRLTGQPLHVWPHSPLVYISVPAVFFWMSNVVVYELLTVNVVDLTPDYDAPGDEPATAAASTPAPGDA